MHIESKNLLIAWWKMKDEMNIIIERKNDDENGALWDDWRKSATTLQTNVEYEVQIREYSIHTNYAKRELTLRDLWFFRYDA